MKISRFLLYVVLMSLSTVGFAQSDMHKATDQPAPSEAQKSFDTMKTFAGEWEGPVAVPEMPEMTDGKALHVSLRVTSRGTRDRARITGSQHAVGCGQVRPSGHHALCGWRPAQPDPLL